MKLLYEVVDGRIVENAIGAYENWLAAVFSGALDRYTEANPVGRVVPEMMFDRRPLSLARTTFASNRAIGGNGAAGTAGGIGTGTAGGPGGAGEGGGVFNAAGATLTVNGTRLCSDQAVGATGRTSRPP